MKDNAAIALEKASFTRNLPLQPAISCRVTTAMATVTLSRFAGYVLLAISGAVDQTLPGPESIYLFITNKKAVGNRFCLEESKWTIILTHAVTYSNMSLCSLSALFSFENFFTTAYQLLWAPLCPVEQL